MGKFLEKFSREYLKKTLEIFFKESQEGYMKKPSPRLNSLQKNFGEGILLETFLKNFLDDPVEEILGGISEGFLKQSMKD